MRALGTTAEFDQLMRRGTTLICKHRTTCGVSTFARQKVAGFVALPEAPLAFEVLAIEQRELSAHIAAVTGVPHGSPQELLLGDGEVIWHGSHHDIELGRLKEASAG